jgi:Putative zinc- or iron-chelating domain
MQPTAQDVLSDAACRTLEACWPKPSAEAVCRAMDEVFTLAEAQWAQRRRSLDYVRSAPPPACSAGCGWCCHQQVGVSVPEALRVAAALTALPEAERTAITTRMGETDRLTRGMTTLERARAHVACPFLALDGRCRIYTVRPLRCRGLYSIDAGFCAACQTDIDTMQARMERGEVKPAFLDTPARLFGNALSGVLAALRKRAPKTLVALELVAAVRALMADPRLGERWLAGRAPESSLHLRADSSKPAESS